MTSKFQIVLSACIVSSVLFCISMDTVAAGKKNKKTGQVVVVDPRGEGLALSCAGCHGTDGKSAGIIPDIYGKSPEYIESALKDFRSGVRTSSVMGRHSKGYSDEEIHLIAQYFGALRKMNK